jgi:serine phosphatase RsbU (regulator of sigma subunit)
MSEPPELLPDRLPSIEGVELAATHLPASPARCDWYDAIALSGGTRLGIAISDVAGRGERAAALANRLRQGVRERASGGDPGHIVGHVNGLVTDVGTEMSTLMFVVFTPATGELRGANAGHPPALIRRTGGAIERWDAARSLPLGVADQDELPEDTVMLAPGDALLLFTDGLLERRGVSIDDALAELEQAVPLFGSAAVLRTAVLEAMLGQGEHDDDVAVIALVVPDGG